MKKRLRNLFAAAAVLFSAGLVQNVQASHFQGGDLTYTSVAPGVYTINLKLYRDCTGSPAPASATLNLKSTGCNPGRNVTLSKVGINRIGNPYCAQIPVSCTATGLTNYEEVTFTTTLIFSAAEQNCANWLISWSECCRPNTANLVGQDNPWQEALINLTPGVNNTSPQFSALNVPIPFVNYNQPIMISLNAMEPDGDSLAYSLVSPWNASNTAIPYKSYPASLAYNSDSTKYALLPAGTFSASFPIISYYIDWSQPMPVTPVPKFMFDTKTGSLGFIPNLYHNTPSINGDNKYALVVQIEEWRKINGVQTKVGMIRRDMLINVIDCGPNQNPSITSPVVNGQAITETDVIRLRPGTPLNMQFSTADANTTDILTLQSDIADVLPGAVFTPGSGNKPTATITWTPTASNIQPNTYYFHVNVEDNACPVKGYQTHTFAVRVSATGGVTGTNEIKLATTGFSVFPNPYTQDLHFKLNLKGKGESIKIYNTLGQLVDQISITGMNLGEQTLAWKNANKYAAGTYVAKLVSADKSVQTLKFTKLQ